MKDKSFVSFFDVINPDNDIPVAAVFSSYGFDAELFENEILPAFLGTMVNKNDDEIGFRRELSAKLKDVSITVLSDANEYNGGQTFLYNHKTITNVVFHPKCHLLLYASKLRIIIGSCNITKSGLCYNAETIWFDDIFLNKESSLIDELKEILDFWKSNYSVEDEAIYEIEKFLLNCKTTNNQVGKIIHTMSQRSPFEAFFEQLNNNKIQPKELCIISPFFETDRMSAFDSSVTVRFLQKVKKNYSNCSIHICFPGDLDEKSGKYIVSAPINILKEIQTNIVLFLHVIEQNWVTTDSNTREEENASRNLHSKLIIIKDYNNKLWILSGSINFTNNAMNSSLSTSIRNIEIGIFDKIDYFEFPASKIVSLKDLIYNKKSVTEPRNIFLIKAVYENHKVKLLANKDLWNPNFELEYCESTIFQAKELCCPENELIEVVPFELKKSLSIHVICENYEFFIPIEVLSKEDYIPECDEITFSLTMNDIIDYWSGKYTTVLELYKNKKESVQTGDIIISGNFFRYNIREYFKALYKLKQDLEKPFFSEKLFYNFLYNSFGLNNLICLLLQELENEHITKNEFFFLELEIENVLAHLDFEDDRLESKIKQKYLISIISKGKETRQNIYKNSFGKIKKEYQILINSYDLEE